MPQVNWALMVATVLIVIGFRSSGALAAAYGIAVTLTMVITVLLLYVVMTERWRWPVPVAAPGHGDLPHDRRGVLRCQRAEDLEVAGCPWPWRRHVHADDHMEVPAAGSSPSGWRVAAVLLEDFVASVAKLKPGACPGTAVYMTAQPTGMPPALAHNLRYNKVLHERVVLLRIVTVQQPTGNEDERFTVETLGHGLYNVTLQYGFMEDPHVPRALLAAAKSRGMKFDFQDVVYFLGRQTILVTDREGMALWREKLFVLMSRNAVRATAYFRLPPERVVELGVQVEM